MECSVVFTRCGQCASYLVHRNQHPDRTGAAPAESFSVYRPPDMSRHVLSRLFFALKIVLSLVAVCGDMDSHLIHGSLSPLESTSQTASRPVHAVQPLLQDSRSWQTDRQTDHATPVATDRTGAVIRLKILHNRFKILCDTHGRKTRLRNIDCRVLKQTKFHRYEARAKRTVAAGPSTANNRRKAHGGRSLALNERRPCRDETDVSVLNI